MNWNRVVEMQVFSALFPYLKCDKSNQLKKNQLSSSSLLIVYTYMLLIVQYDVAWNCLELDNTHQFSRARAKFQICVHLCFKTEFSKVSVSKSSSCCGSSSSIMHTKL